MALASGEVIEGFLPKAAARLVKDWSLARQNQLMENWRRVALVSNPWGYPVLMLTKILAFERLGGYRLLVRFNDGSHGVHDFATMVAESGAMLAPLWDAQYFSRVFMEWGALTWPNGFDIAPEWLRRVMDEAGELSRAAA